MCKVLKISVHGKFRAAGTHIALTTFAQVCCRRCVRMRINFKRNSGSVFIVIMVLTGVIGVTLASYLHLVSNQNVSIMRSMAWNEAVAVSEAGIEEAMAHLNRNRTNRTRDNWNLDGTGTWVIKEKTIGRQKYKVFVEATAEFPRIVSEGYVLHPQTGAWLPSPRTIRVSTTNDAADSSAHVT